MSEPKSLFTSEIQPFEGGYRGIMRLQNGNTICTPERATKREALYDVIDLLTEIANQLDEI